MFAVNSFGLHLFEKNVNFSHTNISLIKMRQLCRTQAHLNFAVIDTLCLNIQDNKKYSINKFLDQNNTIVFIDMHCFFAHLNRTV